MKLSSGTKCRCTLGELIECFDNKRIPLSAQERATRKGPYRYYGAQNVVDHIDAYLFDGEYALIAEDGENLRSQKQDVAQIVEGQFWVNNHAHIIQANANADLWYLCALLNQTDIWRYISGSAQPKLSQEGMRKIVVEVPDVQEQRRIGLLLRCLDRKIALNRKKIATLEKMAKEIYDYWFVQYDFPDANGRPYKSSGGEMVYSPELKREIPKGGRGGCLADIAQYPHETVRRDAIDIDHYVTTDSLLQEKLGRTQASNLPPVPVSLVAFQKADTLVANIRPYLKKIWYASEDGGCSQDVLVFHPINNELAPLLHSIVWQDAFFDYVMAAAKGSKMPRGDKAHIMAYPILLPDKSVVRRFGEVVEKFYAWRECALKESASLTALRDYLLPLLMNGQVKVG